MGYISNKGILAGPIQLNGNASADNGKVWIVPKKEKEYLGIHFSNSKNASASVSGNYFPLFIATPSYNSQTWDSIKHAAATMEWVNSNFVTKGDSDVPSFDPSQYVKVTDFNNLENIVDNNIIRIQTLESKILDIDPLKIRVTTLENNFNSHKNNPYPDGVIFVAGTAAEVV